MQTIFGSHSAIAPFRLVRPATIADAAAALADGGACLAGGVDLVPALRAGRRAERLVYLGGIGALRTIERTTSGIRVGAGVSYERLAHDPLVASALPDLAAIWRGVANVRVRHVATVGGNIMAGNPQYDMLPALLALGAKLVFAGAKGATESVAAGAERWPDALLTAIEIPVGGRFALDRSFKPVISVAAGVELTARGLRGRAAIGCAFPRPVSAALQLDGIADWRGLAGKADGVAEAFAHGLPEPVSDWIAGATYRRALARILLARQLRALAERAE